MAHNATRNRTMSPVIRRPNKLNQQKFARLYQECLTKGLGVKDLAHMLGWHVDETLRNIREINEMRRVCGVGSMEPLRGL